MSDTLELEPQFALPDPEPAPLAVPTRYRWLTLGAQYAYRSAPGKGLDDRRGQACIVLILPRPGARPGNVVVEFLDGVRHVVPAGVLKEER